MTMTTTELQTILDNHKLWLANKGGSYANLSGADLTRANLTRADLTRANLSGANLSGADLIRANLTRADLTRANLSGADLTGADLSGANLSGANLTYAYLTGANLSGADLTDVIGNMRQIKSMQLDTYKIVYTNDFLQIGCQNHAIEKWQSWDTPAGRKWIALMSRDATEWADKYLALVLAIIAASPANSP